MAGERVRYVPTEYCVPETIDVPPLTSGNDIAPMIASKFECVPALLHLVEEIAAPFADTSAPE